MFESQTHSGDYYMNRITTIEDLNKTFFVPSMPPLKKSPVFLNIVDYNQKMLTTKKCSCYTTPLNCPCHSQDNLREDAVIDEQSTSSDCSDSASIVTLKPTDSKTLKQNANAKIRAVNLSISSLSVQDASDSKEKQEALKNWLKKKEVERKRKQAEELKLKEEQEKQRQIIIEKEREMFKKWLKEKKQEEQLKKQQKEMEIQQEKLKEVEKEKRQLENQISYHLWLQKKKKLDIEKKIKQKVSFLQISEEKQKRLEKNERAFCQWLRESKNKPKPLPLNQGLESLRSSLSVTYINPVPWKPNIEIGSAYQQSQ